MRMSESKFFDGRFLGGSFQVIPLFMLRDEFLAFFK